MINVLIYSYNPDSNQYDELGKFIYDEELSFEVKDPEDTDLFESIMKDPVLTIDRKRVDTSSPVEWINNLYLTYTNPYLYAGEPVEQVENQESSLFLTYDNRVYFIDNIDDVLLPTEYAYIYDITDEETEKSILSIAGRAIQFLGDFIGRWITTASGNRVFIRIKNIFKSDVSRSEAKEAAKTFQELPLAVRKAVGKVELRSRNVIERIVPGTTTAKMLGKDYLGRQGYRVSFASEKNYFTFLKSPKGATVTVPGKGEIDVRGVSRVRVQERQFRAPGRFREGVIKVESRATTTSKTETKFGRVRVFQPGPTIQSRFQAEPRDIKILTSTQRKYVIIPGRLKVLNSLKRPSKSDKFAFYGGQVPSYKLKISDLVNRGGGQALYPKESTRSLALQEHTKNFATAMNREGGVTRAAEKMRLNLRKPVLGKHIDVISKIDDVAARENFAELYMVYRGQLRGEFHWTNTWNQLNRTHRRSVEQFFRILQAMDAL